MDIKSELIKRLDDHGYKLNNEGKIVVKFSTCEDDNLRIVTVEKFTIEIGDDWISFRKEKGFKGKLLLDVTFEKFVESSDFYIPRMIDQFEESHADVIGEILNLIYSTLDECIHLSKSENIPDRYRTQSKKNFMEILKNEMLTHDEYIGFLKGNVYKYVFRYRNKGGKKDLRKAKHYLDLLEAEIDE